jgi:hypothetical protein
MENEKWKMENDCVRFAHDLKLFPKEISQFSIAKQFHKPKFPAVGVGQTGNGGGRCRLSQNLTA